MIALSVCAHTWSHDSDKAYFLIDFDRSSDTLIIQSDLPWTIRQAMFKDLDEDSNAYISYYGKNQFEYDEIMYLYFRKNIFFLSGKGDTLFLSSYTKGKPKDHSHGGEVDLIFLVKNWLEDQERYPYEEIKDSIYLTNISEFYHNTVLCNLDSNHINLSRFKHQESEWQFETSLKNVSWQLDFENKDDHAKEQKEKSTKKDASEMAFWLLIGMIPILIVLFLMFRKKF